MLRTAHEKKQQLHSLRQKNMHMMHGKAKGLEAKIFLLAQLSKRLGKNQRKE